MVYVIRFDDNLWAGSGRNSFCPDPARKLSANQYDIYHCCVHRGKTPDDGQRNCTKHVAFYSKNKFEELVRLVGFIIRFYHDSRSPERQIWKIHVECIAEEAVLETDVRMYVETREVV